MPEYKYEGVDRAGKRVAGQLNAASEGDLRVMLRGKGIRPVRIGSVGLAQRDLGSLFKSSGSVDLPLSELVLFTRQLQVLVGSGVPLVQSLEILGDQTSSANIKNLCGGLKTKVSEGSFLYEALAQYPKTFPKLYLALVRAGESSGALDGMLKRLSTYLEDAERLRRMLKGAMMYPTIVVLIGIGVVAAMLVFVIPKFEEMMSSNGQELPGPTQFVINLSHALTHNWWQIIVTLVVSFVLIKRFVSTPEGKIVLDKFFFKMPLFGDILKKGGTARFCRTLSTLLASGVNLLDAIDICRTTMDNAVLEDSIKSVRSEIEQGKNLSVVFSKVTIFPRMAVQMMAVGESTGQLDAMLGKVASFYEAEVEQAIGGLTKLIEPFILVFLGGAVGGLLIAMYLPIFKMAGGVQ